MKGVERSDWKEVMWAVESKIRHVTWVLMRDSRSSREINPLLLFRLRILSIRVSVW